jgi:hypothetical protein
MDLASRGAGNEAELETAHEAAAAALLRHLRARAAAGRCCVCMRKLGPEAREDLCSRNCRRALLAKYGDRIARMRVRR